jgi:hypothetical protein
MEFEPAMNEQLSAKEPILSSVGWMASCISYLKPKTLSII